VRRALPLLLLLATAASAQITVFERGYVVRGGQRVAGWISLGSAEENARGVRFRRQAEGAGEVLLPGVVEGYGTAQGVAFRSGRFPVEGGPQLAFARVVRAGPVDLLALWTPEGDRFFAVRDRDEPVPLLASPDLRAALSGLAPECPEPGDVAATEAALADAVDRLNLCLDPSSVPLVAERTRLRVQVGARLGALGGQLRDRFARRYEAEVGPTQIAPAGALTAALSVPWVPGVHVVGDVGYAPNAIRLGANEYDPRDVDVDLLQGSFGLRYVIDDAIAVAGGVLIEKADRRPTGEVREPDSTRTHLVQGVPSYAIARGLGGFVDLAVTYPGTPASLGVRFEWRRLTGERALQPGLSTNIDGGYALWSLGLSARWRFWAWPN